MRMLKDFWRTLYEIFFDVFTAVASVNSISSYTRHITKDNFTKKSEVSQSPLARIGENVG